MADCRSFHDSCLTNKFADNTGLIMNDDNFHYRQEVDRFVDWYEKNCLVLNAGKTKEMFMDFRWKKPNYKPIMAKRDAVEQVDKCSSLDLVVHNKRAWYKNTDEIIKKVHFSLFCLKNRRSFWVREDSLQLFFLSTISSVLTYSCVCWGGNASKKDRDRLEKTTRKAGGMTGRQHETFDSVFIDDLPIDSTRFWLTKHILWDLNLTLGLLTGVSGWEDP